MKRDMLYLKRLRNLGVNDEIHLETKILNYRMRNNELTTPRGTRDKFGLPTVVRICGICGNANLSANPQTLTGAAESCVHGWDTLTGLIKVYWLKKKTHESFVIHLYLLNGKNYM